MKTPKHYNGNEAFLKTSAKVPIKISRDYYTLNLDIWTENVHVFWVICRVGHATIV